MIGLACASLSCDGFGDNRFVNSLRTMPTIGFRYIELNCWHPPDLTPTNVLNLRRRCREAGLTPIAVYGSSFGGNTPQEIGKDVCHKLRMIDAAVELGCGRIVATGAKRGEGGGIAAVIETLRHIVPYAERRGVLVSLENHASNNLETIEDYETIFAEIDSPNVGVCADTGHFEAASVRLDDVAERLLPKINHIHVKETAAFGEERFVRFGQGVTDNRAFVERMIASGYSGYITVELALPDKSRLIEDLSVPYRQFADYENMPKEVNECSCKEGRR